MKILKKTIALMVAITFIWLLQISAMPLQAATVEASTQEQNPGTVEKAIEDDSAPPVEAKSSILPYILIGLGVAAVAVAVILLLPKSYDIRGTWPISFVSTSPAKNWTWTLTFQGEKGSGTLIDNYGDTGIYTVDGKNIQFSYDDWDIHANGKFDEKDKISGTATFSDLLVGGIAVTSATWNSTRSGTATLQPTPAVSGLNNAKKERAN